MKSNLLLLVFLFPAVVVAQNVPSKVTDSNTALHALQPDYPVPYGAPETEAVKAVLDRIYNFLEASTPARMIDRNTKSEIKDLAKLNSESVFEPGVFRLISYEWGVVYGAMINSAEATGDMKYRDYTIKRMNLIGDVASFYKTGNAGAGPVRSVLEPGALDDAGSMCAAMIKTMNAGGNNNLRQFADNYIEWISEKQQRLSDGTLSRNRPLANALWLDDLYMSIPALAQMGKLTGNIKYYDDACRQLIQFSERMFNSHKNLYMHGWILDMNPHPEYYWARCNGWALLAMSELLDVLPDNHPQRQKILEQFKKHLGGIASFQSGNGLWHQLLDRPDSYLETSATAIFTYCAAHGINKGYLDAQAYGPMAVLGWNAVTTRVNNKGEVEGTCVGTGMAFDPAFYYNRPVNVAAAHGYGPVIMAGAEMINLLKNWQIVINDSAVMFYKPSDNWKNYR